MEPLQYQVVLPVGKNFSSSRLAREYLRSKYDNDVRERGIRDSFTWGDNGLKYERYTRMQSDRFDSVEFVREMDGSQPTLTVVATTEQHRRNLIVILQKLEAFGATKIMESTKKGKTFTIAGVLTYLVCGYVADPITEHPVVTREKVSE